jgi:hypothetical protein
MHQKETNTIAYLGGCSILAGKMVDRWASFLSQISERIVPRQAPLATQPLFFPGLLFELLKVFCTSRHLFDETGFHYFDIDEATKHMHCKSYLQTLQQSFLKKFFEQQKLR